MQDSWKAEVYVRLLGKEEQPSECEFFERFLLFSPPLIRPIIRRNPPIIRARKKAPANIGNIGIILLSIIGYFWLLENTEFTDELNIGILFFVKELV